MMSELQLINYVKSNDKFSKFKFLEIYTPSVFVASNPILE